MGRVTPRICRNEPRPPRRGAILIGDLQAGGRATTRSNSSPIPGVPKAEAQLVARPHSPASLKVFARKVCRDFSSWNASPRDARRLR